jgi:hypothetical protein
MEEFKKITDINLYEAYNLCKIKKYLTLNFIYEIKKPLRRRIY